MRGLVIVVVALIATQLAPAQESQTSGYHQPLMSLAGTFEVTWSVQTSNSHSLRHIADAVRGISLFSNYVVLQTDSGGHVIARDRLIDLKWLGQAKSAPVASAPAPTVEPEPIPAMYLTYSEGVVKKYDTNGDGVLQADEWELVSGDVSAADTNGDGQLTVEEYARSLIKR